MLGMIVTIVLIVWALRAVKEKEAAEKAKNSGRPSAAPVNSARQSRTAKGRQLRTQGEALLARASRVVQNMSEADHDAYQDSLDYCDSNVPDSEGISFHGLPEGTDELEVLIRANRKREKMLQKSLETRKE